AAVGNGARRDRAAAPRAARAPPQLDAEVPVAALAAPAARRPGPLPRALAALLDRGAGLVRRARRRARHGGGPLERAHRELQRPRAGAEEPGAAGVRLPGGEAAPRARPRLRDQGLGRRSARD